MAIEKINILKYAFAEDGDRKDFSVDTTTNGEMSWQQGYPLPYELNPELDGKYIQRNTFNNLMYETTKILKHTQIYGGLIWDIDNVNLIGGYPAGARVLVYYDIRTNQIIKDMPKYNEFLLCKTVVLVSMVDNNMYSPFEKENLFKYWYIDDGNDLFSLKFSTQNPKSDNFATPAGYLDFGDSEVSTKTYNYDDFPRVKYFKDSAMLPAFIIDNGTNFKLMDIRGRFPRIFSNGSSIDGGRSFESLQGDAIRNITGTVIGIGFLRGSQTGVFGTGTALENGASGGSSRTPYFNMDASRQVPTAPENRPYNFNIKAYVKV